MSRAAPKSSRSFRAFWLKVLNRYRQAIATHAAAMFRHNRPSKQNTRRAAARQALSCGEPAARSDLLAASGLLDSKRRAEVRVAAARRPVL